MTDQSWYAVHTKSCQERRVLEDLTEAGIEAFWPHTQERRKWADRAKVIDVALYPGYVFVRIADTAMDRYRVASTRGAVRILGAGREISPIPDTEIDSVKDTLETAAQAATEAERAAAHGKAKWQVIHTINRVSPAPAKSNVIEFPRRSSDQPRKAA
jgi:transcriptional antiterminator NusG